ncbi:sperm acrosome membrane-associated protein 6 [Gastrophryne carolinensis]
MESQEECEDAIREGFKPLDNSFIPSSAFSKVQRYLESFHREVRLIDVLLPPKIWRDRFNKKMAEYVRGVQSIASSLQKEALNYNCSQCKDLNCDLPVACELEDIHVKEGQPTDLFCYVNFTLPTVFSITWMFAYNFRITDLSFFQKISHIHSSLMYIKIFFTGDDDSHLEIKYTRPRHRGTYLCQIEDFVDDILVQKFFFVNVSHKDHTAALRWMENFPKMVAARNRTWPRRRVKLRLSWSEFNLKEYLDDQEPLSIGALVLAAIGPALLFTLFILMCRAAEMWLPARLNWSRVLDDATSAQADWTDKRPCMSRRTRKM